jgi:hypothetical protein
MAGIRGMETIAGRDNVPRSAAAGRTVRSFPLELELDRVVRSDDGTTLVEWVTERWTGRILKRGVPADDVVFPVEFDPSFQETIAANGDDGEEYNDTTWAGGGANARAGSYYGTNSHAGLRFQVGDGSGPSSGDTIDSATLILSAVAMAGSPDIDIHADDVDDAAAWSPTTTEYSLSGNSA